MAKDISENTVSAVNQTIRSSDTSVFGNENAKTKILVVGNSITRHGPCAEIGWERDWGMAASAPEKDYVHRLYAALEKKDVCMRIKQAAYWERHFADENVLETYRQERAFAADIVVFRLGENVSGDVDKAVFYGKLKAFLSYISHEKSQVIVTTCFWKHAAVDECIRRFAAETGAALVDLGSIGAQDEMMALGEFAHEGVAMHPGDRGMAAIAEAIEEKLLPMLEDPNGE